jgi:hypothetical protein
VKTRAHYDILGTIHTHPQSSSIEPSDLDGEAMKRDREHVMGISEQDTRAVAAKA